MGSYRWIGMVAILVAALGMLAGCKDRKTTYTTASGAAATAEEKLLQEAETAWAERENKDQLLVAIGKWEEYVAKDPTNKHVYGMLARAYYLLGNGHETEEEAMLAAYDKGASYAEQGMALNEGFLQCVEKGGKDYKCLDENMTQEDILSVYWAYANIGKWSAISGFTYIVKNKSKLKGISDWVQATDPNFYYGAGDRILGTYYAKAPAAFGGDLDKSLTHFNASLKIEPNYLGTKVLMAQYYCTRKLDRELFVQLCNEVINADPNSIPEIAAEQKLEQGNAQRLLDQVDDLF